jgi:hypothetical protein
MLEISNSSLSTYQTCQKKWAWQYVDGLKPRYKSSALTLGEIMHKAFDRYYKSMSIDAITKFINDTYKEEMANCGPEDQEQIYLDGKTALGMFLNFPFDQMKFEEMHSEEEFNVPLDKNITFTGRVDGKVKREGKWWIREVKTTSESTQMFEKRAAISSQATGYVYGIEARDSVDIQGIIYDYIRKPKLYKRMDECTEEFGHRIYLDYCNIAKKKSYFGRYPTYRTPKDIERWKTDALKTAEEIQSSMTGNKYPRNTNACYAYNTECPYLKICMSEHVDPMIVELFYDKKEEVKV